MRDKCLQFPALFAALTILSLPVSSSLANPVTPVPTCMPAVPKNSVRSFEQPSSGPLQKGFERLKAQQYWCSPVDVPGEVWDCLREKKPEHLVAIGVGSDLVTFTLGDDDTAAPVCLTGAIEPIFTIVRGSPYPRSITHAYRWTGHTWRVLAMPPGMRQGETDADGDGRNELDRLLFDSVWKTCRGEDCPATTRNAQIHLEVTGPAILTKEGFASNSPLVTKAWEQRFSTLLESVASVESPEDVNAKAELGNVAVNYVISGRMLGLPPGPMRTGLAPLQKLLEPSLRSIVDAAWNTPLDALPVAPDRAARLFPETPNWGNSMPVIDGCTAPSPADALGWESPLDQAVRREQGNTEFYHANLGAIIRHSTDTNVMWDSRQANESDYSASKLVMLDASGRRHEFEGGSVNADFVCYAKGEFPFYFVEVATPCHFGCMPEQSLWRLRAEGWRKVTLPSFVYQWLTDIDGDGRVEFEGELAHASYRHCTYIACGSSMENAISVKGYFGWDGARFVPNRATYRRLYSERYADALKLVRSKAGISQSECNEEVLQAIGEVVIYGRMLRHSQSEWLGAIDATMRKSTNAECKPGDDDEHNQTLEFTPWSRIRASLLSEKVAPF